MNTIIKELSKHFISKGSEEKYLFQSGKEGNSVVHKIIDVLTENLKSKYMASI